MRERDTVWLSLAGKYRPGVVLEVRADLVRVAYGTSREHPDAVACAVVHTSSRSGKKFPLSSTTYFYGANTALEVPRELRLGERPCTRDLFNQIRRLVEEHDAAVREPV